MISGHHLKKVKNVHFIGIGGIGMSAIAQLMLEEGKRVSGSDLSPSPVTELLEKKGAELYFEESTESVNKSLDLVVYTLAIDRDNKEFLEAKKLGIPTISYPEILGLVSRDKYTIAVSGTHGKTTTTAMIAKVMIEAGLSPTVIAGSLISEYGSNFVAGQSKYFVVEACEYCRSFLHLEPNVLVITNIEEDHLDYYKDLHDIESAFLELTQKLKKGDFLICNINDPNLEPIIGSKKVECNIIDYYTLSVPKLALQVPGEHNEENAKAALAVSAIFNIDKNKTVKFLEDFKGTWRRLEEKGKTENGSPVFDDYAHHPTEIKASISSLTEMFPDKRIAVVFQPHLYSRTKLLLSEFGPSFEGAAEVVLAPIYPAREKPDPSISSEILAEEVRKAGVPAKSLKDFKEIASYIKKNFESDTVVVTMGAGNIYEVAEIILRG